VLVACSNSADSPKAVLSEAEVQERQAEAISFVDRTLGAWPNLSQFYAEFADGVTFSNPTTADYVEGKDSVAALFQAMTTWFYDVEVEPTRVFISAGDAACDNVFHNLWPPWVIEPPEHPPVHQLDLIQFQDGQVIDYTIMFSEETQEMTDMGCFAVDKCPELREIVDKYLLAWSSRNEAQVAALYAEEAVFSDSMLGLEAVGSGAIADLADKRFGSTGDITLDEIGLYAQTNGSDAPTDEQPELRGIVGVGIHYRWNALVDGASAAVESLTTFEVGSQGLITREEVFHDADSLVASGLAP
jgi:ketosteroid isomerase-like protein